ncbi:C6 zinc finger domain-containing protein [Colletotrichum karsti]|uniref:C6 zinc finger domain-containing protein n=1 Tax=Colletotrichum karsti TaxID=1095194 RepID=A0A9P6IAX0_9PEZI|nr:C6 zinc finger domain-containing protein [Colletotrichum karsti]KAF9879144.1 C6 zinc finger domain-containing protein [Colletotrichum karsti]
MDELLAIYLRTFEHIYRIIHVPTFQKEQETFREHPDMLPSDFIIRFQLCMALGACMHDDTFSLRPCALQWIHEAQEWLESSENRRSTIAGIQVMCLLHLSLQATESLYGDRVWILSGTLLRSAMCLGLHRDPARLPRMSIYQAEMRRRLWTTILELVLDASLDSGQPSLLSSDDYDTELPLNVDDDQIGPDIETVPSAKDMGLLTDTSVQISLGRSIPLRLRLSKHWSKIKPETSYAAILQLSSQLSAARRSLDEALRLMYPKVSQFQYQYCDAVFIRCIFTLHLPYIPLSSPLFCHSHKICTEAALEMSYMTLPISHINDPLLEIIHTTSGIKDQCSDFTRLSLCGSGSFRTAQHLATSVIATELNLMVGNDGINRPAFVVRTAELHMLLRAGVEWSEKRIRAGQDNVKDYVYFAVNLAEIEAKMNGKTLGDAMEKGGLEAVNHAVAVLTEMIGDQAVAQDTGLSFDVDQEELDVMGAFWGDDFPDLGWIDSASQSQM